MNKKRIKNYILFPFKLISILFVLGIYYITFPFWWIHEEIDRKW